MNRRLLMWGTATALVAVIGLAMVLMFAPREERLPTVSPATLLQMNDNSDVGFSESDDKAPMLSMSDEPAENPWGSGDASLAPIALEDADSIVLGVYAENIYLNAQGEQMIDLLERDYAYLSVIVTDDSGRPVVGVEPEFSASGSSELLRPLDVSSRGVTDASGTLDFALIGGQMGLDRITVVHGSTSVDVLVNVISLRAAGFPAPPEVEGMMPWDELMGARISYIDDEYGVEFLPKVAATTGERVKLSGFMVPLDPDLKQSRFLLTSNPPSCFYHIPGGPAGAVEVLARAGIEASWDPIVVEGRFETLQTDEYGVIYRLHDATILQP